VALFVKKAEGKMSMLKHKL